MSQRKLSFLAMLALATLGNPAVFAATRVEQGSASWYSVRTNGGTHTASGQTLRDEAATAAHKSLPLGTKVKVTNLANGRSQVVTITDRGPYIAGRIIDVTIGTAERLGFVGRGVVPVKVETVGQSSAGTRSSPDDKERSNSGSRESSSRGERSFRKDSVPRRSSVWGIFTGPRRF